MIDYKLLQALASVISEGGFDKAARKLNLTQSAVSQRVRLLEEQQGRILVMRSSPPLATEDGKKLIAHLNKVQRLENELMSGLDPSQGGFSSLSIAVNADSLATWFLPVMQKFCLDHNLLMDLKMDDQDQTLKMLKNGEVLGSIGSTDEKVQGCSCVYVGNMDYRLLASPGYKDKWCPGKLTLQNVETIPLVLFNRKDTLHLRLFEQTFGLAPDNISCHYFPSSEGFVHFIASGLGAGMLPDQQSYRYLASKKLINLLPDQKICVPLYWHYWNINSKLIASLTKCITHKTAKQLNPRT